MARMVILIALLAVAILAAVLFLVPKQPSPEALAALDNWMSTDCAVGGDQAQRMELRRYAAELESMLIQIAEQGPPASDVIRVENEARRQYSDIQTSVRSNHYTGLPNIHMQMVIMQKQEERVTTVRNDYIAGQRSAALTGLGVIGTRRGRRLLERIAADPKSPFRDLARLAGEGKAN
jgi:hypothetical protein